MIDLIGNIATILQTLMDWMSKIIVKKVDIWIQSPLVDLITFNHNVVTLTQAGPIVSTWSHLIPILSH
jgi:hypothetical protein